jgi:hypothetical protein
MREDLLGYLLDALDDQQRRRVAEALRRDPRLRRELEQLRQTLEELRPADADIQPPADLADQTCDLIAAFDEAPEAIRARVAGYPSSDGGRRGGFRTNRRELAAAGREWSAADMLVAAGLFLAVSLMFFPAIAESRFRSHISTCQDNLRQLGNALAAYSEFNDGYLPSIPASGNRSVAGVYGPLLYHSQYFTDQTILVCPGSALSGQIDDFRIPRLVELDRAGGRELLAMQRTMGGSYGYTLGYQVGGQYTAPRNRGRSTFALMSDKPSLHLAASQSDNHVGRGQNVLFDDFHVEFLTTCTSKEGFDNLFRSRRGYFEAGLDDNDSVIGPSFMPPLADQ